MNYRDKIRAKWPTQQDLIEWLDRKDPEWKEEDPSMIADSILETALGYDAHGRMEIDLAKEAEEWIIENYLNVPE